MRATFTAALALVAAAAFAAPSHERRIDVSQAGPQRLDVDLALIAGTQANFSDLRIFDATGREVPYLLVQPPTGEALWVETERLPIASTKTTSGGEVDATSIRKIDAIRIAGIPSPFLKRVRVEGSGDRQRWTVLADATVFDLPHQELSRTVIEFAPVEIRYVRVTWDDTSSARVGGRERIALRIHGSSAPPRPLRAQLAARRRPSEPGRSRYRVQLPAPSLPLRAVELQIRGDVFRAVTITEPRLGTGEITPFELGRGQLRQASRDGIVASDTKIAISSPRSSELDLIIEDGNNGPLDIERVTIELAPQPWIYFEAVAPATFVARYGDEKAEAPQYDLEAARDMVGKATTATAKWGAAKHARAHPVDAAPLPVGGAMLDRSKFAVARTIAPAGRGMSTLPLDADVLARSRDLADVRLIDSSGRQVPFIVERRDEPLVLNLSVGARREDESNVSSYRVTLPYSTLPSGSRVVLRTNATVFEREIALRELAPEARDARIIARATWRHADPDRAAPPLRFDLPERVSRELELRIEEGDNAALSIVSAKLLMPAHALRFHHPGTPLTLLYGNPEVSAPRYDLALLAPRLFREPAQQVFFASAVTPGSNDDEGVGRHFFWIAIAVVALLLMLLLARLLRGLTPSQG